MHLDKKSTVPTGDIRNIKLELMLLADVGMLGLPNAGKSTFIRSVSAAKPKVADYPFTTLVPNLGVVRLDAQRSFVVADIPGLIEGASDGAGLGIRFLKHLERCRVLLHLVDVMPIDGSDPVENAKAIIEELEKYSPKLAQKPRWLVFNKVDLLMPDEAEALCQEIVDRLGWESKTYQISAFQKQGTEDVCKDLMDFIDSLPPEVDTKGEEDEEVSFKWSDYHNEQLAQAEAALEDELDDDDWDEDDYDVEVIYRK